MKKILFLAVAIVACGKSSKDNDAPPPSSLAAVSGGCVYRGPILSPPGTTGLTSFGEQCITGQNLRGTAIYNYDKAECDRLEGTFFDESCPANAVARCDYSKDNVSYKIFLYESADLIEPTQQAQAFKDSCSNTQGAWTNLR